MVNKNRDKKVTSKNTLGRLSYSSTHS